MRSKTSTQVMVPYTSWLCPPGLPRPNDPWCNTTAPPMIDLSQPWPVYRPPLAPIAGWTAVVDGSDAGLPDTPYRMIEAGKINKGPKGQPLQVIMGTNHDEMALFIGD